MSLLNTLLAVILTLSLSAAHATQASEPPVVAGHIAFINGQVMVHNPSLPSRALQKGDPVYVGDQIQTRANSYLHLNMVDNAFVALRPESQLTIDTYDYAPSHPEASRIRLDLHHGTSRAVTGKGGQAAKHQYRFNTPLAAIGLRGTDYTVIADSQKIRVSVAQGGVIVTPFGPDCASAQIGPCISALTRELNATVPGAYLEVTGTQKPGVLINPGADKQTPVNKKDALSSTPSDVATEQTQAQTALALSAYGPQPLDTQALVRWGRWSSLLQDNPQGSPGINQVFAPIFPVGLVATNNVFAMAYPSNAIVNLPTEGRASFSLVAAEAYTQQGAQLTPVKVQGGALEMDFGRNTFSTQVNLATSATQTEKVQAQGSIDAYGRMQSIASVSNSNVKGIVLNKGLEVGYLFDKTLSTGGLISGATQWGR
jgi:hypothetical protein